MHVFKAQHFSVQSHFSVNKTTNCSQQSAVRTPPKYKTLQSTLRSSTSRRPPKTQYQAGKIPSMSKTSMAATSGPSCQAALKVSAIGTGPSRPLHPHNIRWSELVNDSEVVPHSLLYQKSVYSCPGHFVLMDDGYTCLKHLPTKGQGKVDVGA